MLMTDFLAEPLNFVLNKYADICYRHFKSNFPIGALMMARERHWRDLYVENDKLKGNHNLNPKEVFERVKRLEAAKEGETYLIIDYFLIDRATNAWEHSEYGVIALHVATNEKWMIPSQWCLKAMEVTKPE